MRISAIKACLFLWLFAAGFTALAQSVTITNPNVESLTIDGSTFTVRWTASPGVLSYVVAIYEIDAQNEKVPGTETFNETDTVNDDDPDNPFYVINFSNTVLNTLGSGRFRFQIFAFYPNVPSGYVSDSFIYTRGRPRPTFQVDGAFNQSVRYLLNVGNANSNPDFLYNLNYTQISGGNNSGSVSVNSDDATVDEDDQRVGSGSGPIELAPGRYNFTLRVTDTQNRPDEEGLPIQGVSATRTIRINGPPVVNFRSGGRPAPVYQYVGNPITVPFDINAQDDYTTNALEVQFDFQGNENPDNTFGQLISTGNQTVSLTLNTPRVYRIRIRLRDRNADLDDLDNAGLRVAGEWTGTRRVRLNTAPVLNQIGAQPATVYQYAGDPTQVPFDILASDDFTDNLAVQFDINGDGAPDYAPDRNLVSVTEGTFTTVNLPIRSPGEYQIRTRVLDLNEDDSEIASPWSAPRRVRLNTPPSLLPGNQPVGVYQQGQAIPFDFILKDDFSARLKLQIDLNGDGTAEHTISDLPNTNDVQLITLPPLTPGNYNNVKIRGIDLNEDGSEAPSAWLPINNPFRVNAPPVFNLIGTNPATVYQYAGDPTQVPFDILASDDFTTNLAIQFDLNGDGVPDYAPPRNLVSVTAGTFTGVNLPIRFPGEYQVRARVLDLNENGSEIASDWSAPRRVRLNTPPFLLEGNQPAGVYQQGQAIPFDFIMRDDFSQTLRMEIDLDGNGTVDRTVDNINSTNDIQLISVSQPPIPPGTYNNVMMRGVDLNEDGSRVAGPWIAVRNDFRVNAPPVLNQIGSNPATIYQYAGDPTLVPFDILASDDFTTNLAIQFDLNGDGVPDYAPIRNVVNVTAGTSTAVNLPIRFPGEYQVRARVLDLNENGSEIASEWSAPRRVRLNTPPFLLEGNQPAGVYQQGQAIPFDFIMRDDFSQTLQLEIDLDGNGTVDRTVDNINNTDAIQLVSVSQPPIPPGVYNDAKIRGVDLSEDGSRAAGAWIAVRNDFRVNTPPTVMVVQTPPAVVTFDAPVTHVPVSIMAHDDFSTTLSVEFDLDNNGVTDYPAPGATLVINRDQATTYSLPFTTPGTKTISVKVFDGTVYSPIAHPFNVRLNLRPVVVIKSPAIGAVIPFNADAPTTVVLNVDDPDSANGAPLAVQINLIAGDGLDPSQINLNVANRVDQSVFLQFTTPGAKLIRVVARDSDQAESRAEYRVLQLDEISAMDQSWIMYE